MERCYTALRKHKSTYEWVIKDFTDYLDLYKDSERAHSLISSDFSPIENDKNRFKLMLNLNVSKSEDLLLTLEWQKLNSEVDLGYSFYILNKEQKMCNKISQLIYRVKDSHYESVKLCEKSYLINSADTLLFNNNLTIGCDLTVYDGDLNKTITYKYKPQYSMTSQLKELLENQICSDFTFEVDNQEIKAHKNILIIRCPVFKAMFGTEMMETKDNRVKIKDISPEVFKMMLEYIYTDEVEASLTKDDAINLFIAADKYQLKDLKGICVENIHGLLNVKNAAEILLFAEQYKIQPLITNVKTFMKIYPAQVLDVAIRLLRDYN